MTWPSSFSIHSSITLSAYCFPFKYFLISLQSEEPVMSSGSTSYVLSLNTLKKFYNIYFLIQIYKKSINK